MYRRVGNRPDAEDLAAEVLLQTLRTLRLPAPVHEVRAYLVKTARTVLADHWRRHYGRAPETLDGELAERAERRDYAPSPAAGARALRILDRLPEHFRQVLELRFLKGYSAREVAAELRVTPGHVRVLQFRALRKAAELGAEVSE